MESAISARQKTIIRELVDLLIINHGLLPVSNRHRDLDDSEFTELSRMAFRYYKMIYTNTNPLDLDLNETKRGIPVQNSPSDTRVCIGCGLELSDPAIPVCNSCRSQLKADYDVLKSLLR
jgi:hypothetical protein